MEHKVLYDDMKHLSIWDSFINSVEFYKWGFNTSTLVKGLCWRIKMNEKWLNNYFSTLIITQHWLSGSTPGESVRLVSITGLVTTDSPSSAAAIWPGITRTLSSISTSTAWSTGADSATSTGASTGVSTGASTGLSTGAAVGTSDDSASFSLRLA